MDHATILVAIVIAVAVIAGILAVQINRKEKVDSLEDHLNKYLGRKDRIYEVSGGRYLFERDIRRTNRRNQSVEKDIKEAKRSESLSRAHKQTASARAAQASRPSAGMRSATGAGRQTGSGIPPRQTNTRTQRTATVGRAGNKSHKGVKAWAILIILVFIIGITQRMNDTRSRTGNLSLDSDPSPITDLFQEITLPDYDLSDPDPAVGEGEQTNYDVLLYQEDGITLRLVDLWENGMTVHMQNETEVSVELYLQGVAFDDEGANIYSFHDLSVEPGAEDDFFLQGYLESTEHSTISVTGSLYSESSDFGYRRLDLVQYPIGGTKTQEGIWEKSSLLYSDDFVEIGHYSESDRDYIVVRNLTDTGLIADLTICPEEADEDEEDWVYQVLPAYAADQTYLYMDSIGSGSRIRVTGSLYRYGSDGYDDEISLDEIFELE